MTTTTQKRTKRIATRKVDGGYRVTGQRRVYGTFTAAFQAAWRTCAESGADLYSIMPDGKWVLMLDTKTIEAYERGHHAETTAAN